MSALLKLAIRNIGRNKRRSVLAVLSVALSILFIVFMQGILKGEMESMVRNYTRQESGHIRITTRAFNDRSKFMPVTENITGADSIVSIVKDIPGVSGKIDLIAERFTFGVLLNNDGNSKSAVAIAGDPENESEISLFKKALLPKSRYLSGPREVIMGSKLAATLKYRLGDNVNVMTQGADYALHLRKFKLVGIFNTKVSVIDETVFQIGLNDARALLRAGKDVQQIFIFIDKYKGADKVAALIRTRLNDESLSVLPWTQVGTTIQMVKMMDGVFGFMFIIIASLGAFIISNIMMMVVMERRKEIGILKSMGLRQKEILTLFLTEGTVLGFFGSAAGIAGGVLVNGLLSIKGLDFTRVMKNVTIPMDSVIYPQFSVVALVQIFITGVAISALMSWLPSRQAAKMNAVDAIKSV